MSTSTVRDWARTNVWAHVSRAQPVYPLGTFLLVSTGLLSAVPGGSVRGFELTADATPLEVAGHSTVAVVGYVNLGQQHAYVTVESLLLVALASVLATRGGFASFAGVVLAAGAVTWLIVVTGCPCGVGSATSLWEFIL